MKRRRQLPLARLLFLPDERAGEAGVAEEDEQFERVPDDREHAEVARTEQPRQRDRADQHDQLVRDGARRQRRDGFRHDAVQRVDVDVGFGRALHASVIPCATKSRRHEGHHFVKRKLRGFVSSWPTVA